MVWPKDRLASSPSWTLPEGYILRAYEEGDEKGYVRVMRSAGFSDWNRQNVDNVLHRCLPGGLVFVVHDGTDIIVATAVALNNPDTHHPSGGELGWVAAHPGHRGKGLGLIVCAAATRCFLDAGYSDIYLKTDDFRLPAIRVYFKLGYVPFLHAPDMEERWKAVCRNLNIEFGDTSCVRLHT